MRGRQEQVGVGGDTGIEEKNIHGIWGAAEYLT